MIRISTTQIESFRRLLQTPYGTDQELIDSIKGKPWEPSWQMKAGSAWHALLESEITPITDLGTIKVEGYSFDSKAMRRAHEHIGPLGVWEAKATRRFDLHRFAVEVVAKADHTRGLVIQENKTKFSPSDPRDYEESLQWRFYLAVTGASEMRYNLFSMTDPKDGYCELKDILSFSFFPYADLERDCRFWVTEFVLWCNARGLLGYLEREGSSIGVECAA